MLLLCLIVLAGELFAADSANLRAKVLDVDGKPVAGVKIFIYQGVNVRKPADFISASTDSSGVVVVALPPGMYRAVARVKQGALFGPLMPGDRHSGESTEIEGESGVETGADFVIADIREIGQKKRTDTGDVVRLHGRIVDAAGKPVANAFAFAQRTKEIPALPDFISAWADEDGSYELYLPDSNSFFVGASTQFPLRAGVTAASEIGTHAGTSDIPMDLRITY